jgi:hypothetical protein
MLSALPFVILLLLMVAAFFGSRAAEKANNKAIATLSGLTCPACDRMYGVETAKLARQEHVVDIIHPNLGRSNTRVKIANPTKPPTRFITMSRIVS